MKAFLHTFTKPFRNSTTRPLNELNKRKLDQEEEEEEEKVEEKVEKLEKIETEKTSSILNSTTTSIQTHTQHSSKDQPSLTKVQVLNPTQETTNSISSYNENFNLDLMDTVLDSHDPEETLALDERLINHVDENQPIPLSSSTSNHPSNSLKKLTRTTTSLKSMDEKSKLTKKVTFAQGLMSSSSKSKPTPTTVATEKTPFSLPTTQKIKVEIEKKDQKVSSQVLETSVAGKPEIDPHSDSEDEEYAAQLVNTVGNIPMTWYDTFDHIGYDLDGRKIMKPATPDELDAYLNKMDDPTYWKSVYDELNKKNIVLTEKDLEVVHRLHQGHFADPKVDPYPKTIEWFTSLPETMPLSSTLEPKRRFLPSKWEAKKIAHLVRALKNQPQRTQKDTNTSDSSSSSQETSGTPSYFDLWNTSTSYHVTSSSLDIPPPKLSLPGHADSYHPPPEYLIKPNELVKLQNEHASLDDIPQRFSAMRLVPAYEKFIQERFQRCLDLYLCPRVRKNRIDIDPESLIPKLPDPEDLEPFPKQCALTYVGHTDFVRSVSYSPTGQYFISGSEDQTVRLWDALRGRCLYVWTWNAPVTCVAWNPNKGLSVIAVAVENEVYLIHVGNILNGALFNGNVIQHTTQILQGTTTELKGLTAQCEWKKPSQTSQQSGGVWLLRHHQSVTQIHWHNKGDYFTTVVPKGGAASVFIHQLSRKLSQQPFKNNKGIMVQALFHPTQPLLCIATQRLVRIYDLTKKQLTQKLTSGVQWISSMAIHPSGQHVIVGSYCKRLCWWDTDLSSQPYKTLRYHTKALRSVHFHPTYPLFASSADDGCIQIFHGQVYKDLFSHPLIVPLKILKGHRLVEKLGVLSIQWHPHQPWLLSAGADHSLKLWV